MLRTLVYVGTYTEPIRFGTGKVLIGKGEGIYLLELDLYSGKLKHLKTFSKIINPSYLAINKKSRYLYAVNELKEYCGEASGSVSAFTITKSSGALTHINTRPTGGTDPCHVEIDSAGTHIYVSNFMSGSVCVFPLDPNGSIKESSQFIQHKGKSIDPIRQAGPHAHSLVFSPDEQYAFVPDLGLDKLMIYRVDPKTHTLHEREVLSFEVKPGAGPRHCTFDAGGKFCYLINELDSTILVLSYDQQAGFFTELQCVSSLPDGYQAPGNTCADIHIAPDGRYLYGSNRGHDSVIIYKVDQKTGMLSFVDCPSCGGKTPRKFTIDPSGKFLLCANQDSDEIVVFSIEKDSGLLNGESRIAIPTPVCVKSIRW